MLDSKYVAYFLDEVMDWRKKLSNADATINAWFKVQQTWMHLESIFIGSEDIRSQLPEESKRFEKIDKDFKVTLNSDKSSFKYFKKEVLVKRCRVLNIKDHLKKLYLKILIIFINHVIFLFNFYFL